MGQRLGGYMPLDLKLGVRTLRQVPGGEGGVLNGMDNQWSTVQSIGGTHTDTGQRPGERAAA